MATPILTVFLLLFASGLIENIVIAFKPGHGPMEDVQPQPRNNAYYDRMDNAYNKRSNTNVFAGQMNRNPHKIDNPFLQLNHKKINNVNTDTSIPNWDHTKQLSLPKELYKKVQKNSESTIKSTYPDSTRTKMPSKSLKFEKEQPYSAIRRNKITGAKKSSTRYSGPCRLKESETIADCQNLNLVTVPQNLPRSITRLVLSRNNLNFDSLKDGPFRLYGQLISLLLDSNNISSLPDQSFIGLPKLGMLGLSNNSIIMDSALNQSKAFVPLKNSLYHLCLNNNTKDVNMPTLVYPDKALSYLMNLGALQIDGLPNTTFGYHFSKLSKLTNLSLEGYFTGQCNLSYFQNDTFQYLPTVRILIIADCKIHKSLTESDALAPLKNLVQLDVSYNFELGLGGLGKLMHGQRNNQNLKRIIMMDIVQRYEPCIVLYRGMLKNFKKLSLEHIDATHNNIEMIEFDAIEHLPKTLKSVNLARNNIMFGAYWNHLKNMRNLQSLYLDGYDEAYRLPNRPPPIDIHCPPHDQGNGEHYHKTGAFGRNDNDYNFNGPLTLQLPPKLENISMKSYSLSYKIDTIVFNSINNLTSVVLRGNNFPRLNGPIRGLDKLKHLDFSSCSVGEISSQFFSSFKSLKTVNLYNNMLGDGFSKQPPSFVSNSLEVLDIGANGINNLNENMFKGCPSLTKVTLSDNRLRTVGSVFDKLPKLKELNLTLNEIHTLPKTVRDHFENMKERGFIDMTFNPIDCTCDNIEFLQWVTRTKIFGNDYTNYLCNYPGQRYVSSKMDHGYEQELKYLLNQCANNTKLLICVISATVAFFIILIGVIIYRFRWSMRYWYYTAKVMLTNKSNTTTIEEFEYDLFVCYCHHDNDFINEELGIKLGQERNLKLLLHDKCFQAGQQIAESILMAVQHSRKTLVVMSKAMLDSAWCNYELEMARQESTSTGRNVLVILFLETIPKVKMSLDVLNYIKSNVIVTYPADDPEHLDQFWDRLARDLQSS